MANHLRQQIREAAAGASVLGALTTTAANVFQSRTHELQDTILPALRIYTNSENVEISSLGVSRLRRHELDLLVEACAKQSADLDDKLDLICKEVDVALGTALGQGIGGAKQVDLQHIELDYEGEAEKEVGVARMTYRVVYYTALGAPDVAL